MDQLEAICRDLERIRQDRPLIHNITNFVVMNETANAILCLGALPIMSHAIEEVEEMVGIASALVLNVGTLTPDWVDAMERAGKRANELDIPVILDPVGAGATRLRTESSRRLLNEVRISVVRGNAGEIAALAGIDSEVRGVESIGASASAEEIAARFASTRGSVAAVTGEVDVVSDGKQTAKIHNGHAMLGKVVGTGCMSTAIVGCFAAVESDPFTAAVGGLVALGIAGEMAADTSGERPGTFHAHLYDSLYALDCARIRKLARVALA
ncbi:MAG: hydroxyethylthiazole kinase [Armatimonadetes bacterium RBG_16_58_9]|nr:MAG: hydroxyethylthiazole kinase [Armatimonadetes bacterium RBG_16_58_9]